MFDDNTNVLVEDYTIKTQILIIFFLKCFFRKYEKQQLCCYFVFLHSQVHFYCKMLLTKKKIIYDIAPCLFIYKKEFREIDENFLRFD